MLRPDELERCIMIGKSVRSSSTFVWSVIILKRLFHPGNHPLLEDIDELEVLDELEEVELLELYCSELLEELELVDDELEELELYCSLELLDVLEELVLLDVLEELVLLDVLEELVLLDVLEELELYCSLELLDVLEELELLDVLEELEELEELELLDRSEIAKMKVPHSALTVDVIVDVPVAVFSGLTPSAIAKLTSFPAGPLYCISYSSFHGGSDVTISYPLNVDRTAF